MANFRKIFLYSNTASSSLVTSGNTQFPTEQYPNAFLDEKLVLCITFFNPDGTAYQFSAGETFELTIDDNYLHTDDPMFFASHEYFNIPGDWDEANINEGKLSIRVHCNTYTMVNKVGSSPTKEAMIQVKSYNSGSSSVILHTKMNITNVLNRTGSSVPVDTEQYYTQIQSDSLFTKINKFNLETALPIALDSNSFTKTNSVHELTTIANIEIDTINGSQTGHCLLLYTDDEVNTITLRHNVANLKLPNASDLILISGKLYLLYFNGNSWRING